MDFGFGKYPPRCTFTGDTARSYANFSETAATLPDAANSG